MTVISITGFEILIALAFIAMLATRKPWRLPPIWIPLAFFIFGTLVSLLASGHVREGLPQIRKIYVYLMLFLVVSTFNNVRQIVRLSMVWALAAAASALRGMQQFAQKYEAGYLAYVDHRITGFMNHWMTLGGEMMIVLLLIGAFVLFAGRRRSKWLLLLAALPIGVALYETWTRSSWLGAICGSIYLIWFWRRWALILLPVLVGVVLVLSPAAFRERAVSSFSPHGAVDSNLHKEELRRIGWQMIKAHPWLGIGPEQVSRQLPNYLPPGTPLRPHEYYGHLENDYLQYAAERGVPTMLALLWMIGWAVFDFARALRRMPAAAEERWVLHAAIAVTIGVVASGFGSWNLNNSNILAMFLTVLGCGYVAANAVLPPRPFST
jgi:O-antigen ligase